MTQQEFQSFADNYTSADFDRIKMVWNGKYGNEFDDKNYDFRTQLCEFLIPQLDTAKLELIRDLYLETGKSSEMTFGVYLNFHLFAQQLCILPTNHILPKASALDSFAIKNANQTATTPGKVFNDRALATERPYSKAILPAAGYSLSQFSLLAQAISVLCQ